MVVRVEMVVMEKKRKGDGGEDGSFVVVVMEFVEGGEVVAEKVTGKIVGVVTGGVAEEEGLGPLLGRVAGLGVVVGCWFGGGF